MSKKVLYSLLFIIILLLNLYSLKPILKSGFYFDDTYNSQTKAYLSYENKSVSDYNKQISSGWIQHGRIIPGFIYGGYSLWTTLFYNLIRYKVFIITLHIIVIAAYSILLYKLTNSIIIFLLSFLIIPLFFQFRRSPDPVTSFGFLVPLTLLYLASSFTFLKEYLKTNKNIFIIISLFFYLLMLLMLYEIAYIFFPIAIYLIYLHKKKLLPTLKFSLPYIILSLIFIAIYFYVLIHATVGTYNGSTINFNIRLIISAFLKQISASLPLSYFFVSKPQFFHINILDYFYAAILAITSFVLLISYKLKKQTLFLFFSIGFLLIFLSTIPISLSKRYQLEVAWGIGHLPVYIAYFGTASILIGVILLITNKLKNSLLKKLFILLISIFIGIIGFLNLQNNKLVVEDLNNIFKYPRDLVETSLKSKLISNIPKNATLISLNGLYWDNSSFYSDITKKRLEVIDPETFINKSENKKEIADLKIAKDINNTYVIKYQIINKDLGYVYVGKVTDIYYVNKDENLFLVKNPQIFIKNNSSYKFVDYRSYSNLYEKGFKKNRIMLNKLKLLGKKGDYEVYEINCEDIINFDSIKLINPNNLAELNNQNNINIIEKAYIDDFFLIWKQGFSGLEGNNENNWRWATNKNRLSIINLSPNIKTIKIIMTVSSGFEEISNLNIRKADSDLDDHLKISIIPTMYERVIYLNPGINQLDFISDSKKIINLNDPRDLRFKITNFIAEEIK